MAKEDMIIQEGLKDPEKPYSFTILRPGGNDTALVMGVIRDGKLRREVNDALMGKYKTVEQVGFVNIDLDCTELMMAGGEFCGNATRSTAWLALGGQPGELSITVSGVKNKLRAGVSADGDAYAQMPIYPDFNKISPDPYAPENQIVEMEGITQYINFKIEEIAGLSSEQIKAKALALIRGKGLDRFSASGVIYSQSVGDQWRITPVVYVRAIDTLFLETACGSGTIALGMVLAMKRRSSIFDVPIIQPTGLPIKTTVVLKGQSFEYGQISGPIEVILPLSSQSLSIKETT